MREIIISYECMDFVRSKGSSLEKKFTHLLEVVRLRKVIHSKIIKKIKGTEFYELWLVSRNQIRIIVYSVDSLNFNECICLHGFMKKSNSDYKKAVQRARKQLSHYNEIL